MENSPQIPSALIAILLNRLGFEASKSGWSAYCLRSTSDLGGKNVTSPAKLYEAIYAGRPLLLLCPEGTTTRLARRAGGCWIAHPEDAPGIRKTLLALFERWKSGWPIESPRQEAVSFYSRIHQSSRLLRFLSSVANPLASSHTSCLQRAPRGTLPAAAGILPK
ncbi:MAG: hypothetical protein HY645_10800 [Acidobacteria bacterium]|nr:hypothetical protein [Acidobacteriota bacterium]